MLTEIHITADRDTWTGASTLALHCARRAADAVVITAGGTDHLRRFERGGVKALQSKLSGMFASLSLSRVLRHVPGTEFAVVLHSPEIEHTVTQAISLTQRPEPMRIVPAPVVEHFPPVEVTKGPADGVPLYMWHGNITAHCGLAEIIEKLGQRRDEPWRLRVVGQGQARVVSPLLKRCRALGIADRIEWIGWADDVYAHMNGVTHGIARPGSIAAMELRAASIEVINPDSI